jgi:predicted regulator of Ras-like GTPase activity (Roadblock/LC7/MglB family)
MTVVDEIIAKLLLDTNALGVWLLGPMPIANHQYQNDVPAAAVKDSSIKPALKVVVESETYLVASNQDQSDVLAAAVKSSSIKPPLKVVVESEAYLDFVDRRIFALPIGPAVLVVVFDEQSSLGLIRLRVRRAREAIVAALAART